MDENVAKAVDRLSQFVDDKPNSLGDKWDRSITAGNLAIIRTRLVELEAERVTHIKLLADCFRMSGADPDGNEDWRIAPEALRAVTDLRRDYDEVLDWQARCEKAEALLSETLDWDSNEELKERITAHLSENGHDL